MVGGALEFDRCDFERPTLDRLTLPLTLGGACRSSGAAECDQDDQESDESINAATRVRCGHGAACARDEELEVGLHGTGRAAARRAAISQAWRVRRNR